jgi:putative ABC transport system permease protein
MQTTDVGYDRHNLVRLKMDATLKPKYEALKNTLLEHPDILAVTKATHSLSGVYWNGVNWTWEGKEDPSLNPLVTFMGVGDDWLETFEIEMADGRFFTPGTQENEREAIINETFANMMGEGSAVGKWLTSPDLEEPGIIIGVVKDFHFKPVYRPVDPIILTHNAGYSLYSVFARISGDNVPETIAYIEDTYREFNPDRYLELGFVEEEYEDMYRFTRFRGEILRDFAILAFVISCLGLFGLASYMTEQRSKEIGIRKVLGASVSGIVTLLTKEFIRWVIVANVIAWPIAFVLMRRWLEGFNSHVGLSYTPFLLATAAALLIATIAVSFRAVQAAVSNPVDAIRYE